MRLIRTLIFSLLSAFALFVNPYVHASEIRAYDADGQFLGILMGHVAYPTSGDTNPPKVSCAEIFIPALEKTIIIDKSTGDAYENPHNFDLRYNDENCTGTAFTPAENGVVDAIQKRQERDCTGAFPLYYIVEAQTGSYVARSSMSCVIDGCYDEPENTEGYKPYKVIEIPVGNIPFTLPVKLPLRYNYAESIGGINGDNKVGLEEAIHALQVTSGIQQQ